MFFVHAFVFVFVYVLVKLVVKELLSSWILCQFLNHMQEWFGNTTRFLVMDHIWSFIWESMSVNIGVKQACSMPSYYMCFLCLRVAKYSSYISTIAGSVVIWITEGRTFSRIWDF